VKHANGAGPFSLVPRQGDDAPGRIWTFDEFAPSDQGAVADLAAGLTSVGFIRAALRRGAWLWCTTALVGLLAGFGVLIKLPPAHQASASVLLGINNFEEPSQAATDDMALAESRTVARYAIQELGLRQTPASLTANYTVIPFTNRVLLFTVKARSSQAAVREANALTAAFIKFQKQVVEAAGQNVDTLLQQKIAAAQANVASINRQISRVSAQPASPARTARLSSLRAQSTLASSALTALKVSSADNKTLMRINTEILVGGTQVLDSAIPITKSRKRLLVIYVGTGLIGGLVLGLLIVIVRALVSDRLRRRDDVVRALGAPIGLSVGKVRPSRWRPGPRGLAAAHSTEIKRIVAHLVSVAPPGSRRMATLAVVPVRDPRVAALSLAALACRCAQGLPDSRIVVADLCPGAPAARLLGMNTCGVRDIQVDGVRLVVAVPDRDDVAPVGPRSRSSLLGQRSEFTEAVSAACESADLLLTLATLDPSVGGDYLAGWADGAVAVVTAGESSAERIHAVGEMIRLSGTELVSAVLVGADKTDESLGVTDRSTSSASMDRGLSSPAR